MIPDERGGELTGFEQVTKLYGLRYGMLQHASIGIFVRHYSVGSVSMSR
jgi:hypothetical protein